MQYSLTYVVSTGKVKVTGYKHEICKGESTTSCTCILFHLVILLSLFLIFFLGRRLILLTVTDKSKYMKQLDTLFLKLDPFSFIPLTNVHTDSEHNKENLKILLLCSNCLELDVNAGR